MYKANASEGNSYTYTVILNKHVTFKPTALEHINFPFEWKLVCFTEQNRNVFCKPRSAVQNPSTHIWRVTF